MDSFSIVMTIAIILFARLGVRLVTRYIEMKKEGKEGKEGEKEEKN
tara:strand:+ start:6658 stop:6795 length:138 start_codon:yes stop_codon:yes gene_type:complete